MEIEFDDAKNEVNIAKHNMELEFAAELDLETAVVITDNRKNYGETRFIAYGYIDVRLYVMLFTIRGKNIRVISSLRKANAKERKKHEK